ncbi:endonuclease/exonuclease/phosphatase family protein [Cystobacter fuscus]
MSKAMGWGGRGMLKVLTLNIAHGVPSIPVPLPFLLPRRRLLGHLDAMADLLAREGAEVVALQEVDRAGLFSGTVDPLERLATRAGYPHLLHGPHLHLPGVCARGTALLSRRPCSSPSGTPSRRTGPWTRATWWRRWRTRAACSTSSRCTWTASPSAAANDRWPGCSRRSGGAHLVPAWCWET